MWRIALPWQPARYKLSLLRLRHILTYLLTSLLWLITMLGCLCANRKINMLLSLTVRSRADHVGAYSDGESSTLVEAEKTTWHVALDADEAAEWNCLKPHHTCTPDTRTNHTGKLTGSMLTPRCRQLLCRYFYTLHRCIIYNMTQVQRSEIRHKIKYQSSKQFLQQVSP